jgi:SAM-dependent methyltransferase
MRRTRSIGPGYFEQLYRDKGDPWQFASSPYEQAKYRHSLQALPNDKYASALEVGCSIGVLTRLLAGRCTALLAVDVSETALAEAARRCADAPNVTFARLQIPQDAVEGRFDLIVLSEVVYYWDLADLARAAEMLYRVLTPGGDLLLVHYVAETDYPLSGDDATEAMLACLGTRMQPLVANRRELYRLDVWRRSGGEAERV